MKKKKKKHVYGETGVCESESLFFFSYIIVNG